MEDKKTETIREYLKIKKIEQEDKSNELIEEVYKEVITTKGAEKDERE